MKIQLILVLQYLNELLNEEADFKKSSSKAWIDSTMDKVISLHGLNWVQIQALHVGPWTWLRVIPEQSQSKLWAPRVWHKNKHKINKNIQHVNILHLIDIYEMLPLTVVEHTLVVV